MILLGLIAVLGLITAVIANNKGHNMFLWWLFGSAFFIVALPIALIMKPKPRSGVTRSCPFCMEVVPATASVCRQCHRDLPPMGTWAEDPYHRHELRYFDATNGWTGFVQDHGQQSVDSVG